MDSKSEFWNHLMKYSKFEKLNTVYAGARGVESARHSFTVNKSINQIKTAVFTLILHFCIRNIISQELFNRGVKKADRLD